MPLLKFLRLQQLAMPSRLNVFSVSLLLAIPAFMFWLWLVIVPTRVKILCPQVCWCDRGGYHVTCNNASLNTVPLIPLTGVRVLELHDNNISLFERDTFVSLTEMNGLYASWCGLRTIELGAFNGLTKLTKLFLMHNEISEILPGTFENVSNLLYLVLYKNSLEHLDRDMFRGLVNIQYIYLGYNKLQYLHPDTFLGSPNLQDLYLNFNPTLHIPTDRNLINSPSLTRLEIAGCNVSSLSVETFANVSALETLDLSDNNLRTVDINILRALPKLSELYLHGNPLQCDCQLQEVWRWCEDRNIETVYEEIKPECDTPREVQGMWWGVLENGQCLEGNIEYYGDYNITNITDTGIDPMYIKEDDLEFFKSYQILVYAFPFIFGTISNVILLIIIICNKDMRTLPNMYILNLAIGDIIYLAAVFSEACANRISGTWLEGDFVCTFLPFCRRMTVGLSAYSLAVYSFQRYRITVNPLQALVSSQATWRVTVATIFGVWIVAALFAVPSTLSQYVCENIFLASYVKYYQLVFVFELLVSCVLPLCVIAFSYVMTARHLVESSRPISEGTQNRQQLKTRKNTAKIVVGLTVVFMISSVPYHVVVTYFIYSKEFFLFKIADSVDHPNHKFQYPYLISNCFLLINSCLNPVALFCTSSPLRQHLKRYLTCFCKTNSPPAELELKRRN